MEDRIYKEEVLVVDKQLFENYIQANKIMAEQFIKFTSITGDLLRHLDMMDSRLQALDGLVGLITQTSGSISTNLKMRDNTNKTRTGTEAPAYKQGVDEEELKKAYENNNCVCDKDFLEKYSQKYKVSAGTIRNRLKSLGVYKGRE